MVGKRCGDKYQGDEEVMESVPEDRGNVQTCPRTGGTGGQRVPTRAADGGEGTREAAKARSPIVGSGEGRSERHLLRGRPCSSLSCQHWVFVCV